MGGATCLKASVTLPLEISIHAPRGGSDRSGTQRRSTGHYFNPRSPWGERLDAAGAAVGHRNFNPRSPWGERLDGKTESVAQGPFQSTLPVGGATDIIQHIRQWLIISIHAPRGGSDTSGMISCPACGYFNPRSPWGERPNGSSASTMQLDFNPRSPWGERRRTTTGSCKPMIISIHAPRGGSDPRSSWRRWLAPRISIHAPRGGSDYRQPYSLLSSKHFNPRSPWGERLVHM